MTRIETALLTLFIASVAIVWGVRLLVWLVRR
jgi:hypothetical protein